MASFIIKGADLAVRKKLTEIPMSKICISAITEAELLFGLAKRQDAIKLKAAVHEFLVRVTILPWDSGAASWYATLRKTFEEEGKTLGAMDMLIAAHSMAANAILVTNDQAFYKMNPFLILADWTKTS